MHPDLNYLLLNEHLKLDMFKLIATIKTILDHPLSRRNEHIAILNLLKWQIRIRLNGSSIIIPWIQDSSFICGKGETGLTGNIYTGLFEFEEMSFLIHALSPREIFVDVGANVGAYTILASQVIKSRSISFEPIPETVKRLEKQIQLNRIEELVDVRPMGVGSTNNPLAFTTNSDTTNKVSIDSGVENAEFFKVTTLDEDLTGDGPYFLKIDVEGFEYSVLEGSKNILKSGKIMAIIIELNQNGEKFGHTNDEIHEVLNSHGYTAVSYDPFNRNLKILNSYNHKLPNTIYVKDVELISNRCKSAPLRIIHPLGKRTI